MLSGVMNTENFTDCLRDISQRRRHGTLKIDSPKGEINVLFVQGRVVDVTGSGVDSCRDLFTRLKERFSLPANLNLDINLPDYAGLQKWLNENSIQVGDNDLRFAIRHRVLDRIYALAEVQGATFLFNAHMVTYDRNLCPAVSVGQILLDLVAVGAEKEKFAQVFCEDCWIKVRADGAKVLSNEELEICLLVGSGISLKDLRDRSVLSTFHFCEALLSLHHQGLMEIVNNSRLQASDLDDLADAFDISIDDSLGAILGPVQAQSPLVLGEDSQASRPEELDSSEDAELESGPGTVLPLSRRVALFNSQLLQLTVIPRLITTIFLFCAIFAPFLFWPSLPIDF